MDGLQRLGDDYVAVNGDGQQVDHGGDAEQGAAEGVHLTAWKTNQRPFHQQAAREHACQC